MRELVIISGKGGTGKTSITAALAVLAERPVVADCDVDAADLHLILSPQIKARHEFFAGREAVIRQADCIACGDCLAHCRFEAVKVSKDSASEQKFSIDPTACEGCGVCIRFCPVKAIDFPERLCGEWFVSETRVGPMVYAKLGIAAENSGKLVSIVRKQARQIAEAEDRSLIIIDGPPGIGCPVIASITGATQVLVVTEPTVSGEHDLERVLSLTRHFGIPTSVCVNKWDLNPGMTDRIEKKARKSNARVVGRIGYDLSVTKAQLQALSVVETDSPCAVDIKNIWNKLGLTGD
ncbi:MAG TPA: ATP-binding protein [Candidatus Marinimicrobia bacterium]|nr:ATP-binding protein [Candidatus Neomarinimicrobiota bacterium]HQH56850.1 ATP-binding protein [Candidatus Neomarinimicrobiota bacterium]HRS90433.1 ATP-binding protein [Candidatus Neomarinimicrobiota bacterium]HRU45616.1 ATP-binding protein [Candidatus Neomarinimicrobiota bacterium]